MFYPLQFFRSFTLRIFFVEILTFVFFEILPFVRASPHIPGQERERPAAPDETVIIEKSHYDNCDDILDGDVDGNDDVDEGRPPPPQFASDVCSPLQWEGKGALKGRIQEDGT